MVAEPLGSRASFSSETSRRFCLLPDNTEEFRLWVLTRREDWWDLDPFSTSAKEKLVLLLMCQTAVPQQQCTLNEAFICRGLLVSETTFHC